MLHDGLIASVEGFPSSDLEFYFLLNSTTKTRSKISKHDVSFGILHDCNAVVAYIYFNPLKTKRRPLYLKTQSVPRCKHFSICVIKTNQFML